MERLKALRHELKSELRALYKGRDSRYERRAQRGCWTCARATSG